MAQIKKVTMKDIAQELDISIVTVSKALAGKDGVGDRLREEIIDKAKELGYIFKKNEDAERVAEAAAALQVLGYSKKEVENR